MMVDEFSIMLPVIKLLVMCTWEFDVLFYTDEEMLSIRLFGYECVRWYFMTLVGVYVYSVLSICWFNELYSLSNPCS